MFCFCLQRSLLKLAEGGGPSPGSSPEDGGPDPGSKELKSPFVPAEPEHKTRAVCHPAPPELETALLTPPPLSPPDSPPTGSPEGGCGSGGGALLQLLGGGACPPLPSPRSSALSLRFNSDPDAAPSPPCSQQYILSRARGDRSEGPSDPCPPSVSFLTRHIQSLKKRVRRFEDQFQLELHYKPSHNDKYSDPEMIRVMNELAKARKQLKELRLRQSVFEMKEHDGAENSDLCSCGQQGPEHRSSLEETVESLFKRLKEKRRELGLPLNIKEMTQAQMVLEKITLQKCLLYFESLHGRPGTKQEKNLVKPLYDRYQMIKRSLCASPITTITEEEDGSDEDSASSLEHQAPPPQAPPPQAPPPQAPPPQAPPPLRSLIPAGGDEDSDRDSDPAFVSPIDEAKGVRQQAAVTTAHLHAASRSQLLQSLRETRAEKKLRRKNLREFEEQFYRQTGRLVQKEDRSPMKEEYQEYKQLKAKLRLLEVLLSKQEVTKQEVTKQEVTSSSWKHSTFSPSA